MTYQLMGSTECIDHTGIVEQVNEKSVLVRFQTPPACGSCTARSLCAPVSSENKSVEVFNRSGLFSKGEIVRISITKSMGIKALFYGYILPFILVISVLIICFLAGMSEGIAGLISLSVLIPYYFILYLFRDKINRIFVFTVNKVN